MRDPIEHEDYGRYRKFGFKLGKLYHNGHDWDCPVNTYVHAIADGKIIFSDMVNGFGSLNPRSPGGVILIEHNINGLEFVSLYGHIKRFHAENVPVEEGQPIGLIDDFYNAGIHLPHLHFAIHKGLGKPEGKWGYVPIDELIDWYDPLKFIQEHKNG